MRNIMAHLKRVTADRLAGFSGAHPFLFKAVPALGKEDKQAADKRARPDQADTLLRPSAMRRCGST